MGPGSLYRVLVLISILVILVVLGPWGSLHLVLVLLPMTSLKRNVCVVRLKKATYVRRMAGHVTNGT